MDGKYQQSLAITGIKFLYYIYYQTHILIS